MAAAIVFGAVWILGFALQYTLGGFIHLFLALAVIAVVVRLVAGRRLA